MAKYGLKVASETKSTRAQKDIRSVVIHYFRPVLPSEPATLSVHEVSVVKLWSTLRVDLFQRDKLAASALILITDFSRSGFTIDNHWRLSPPARSVDLLKLEADADPNWTSYHTAYHPNGYRRVHSYVKYFIPSQVSPDSHFTEQWLVPGWDCNPLGSCAAKDDNDKARWTNDMIPFILDLGFPVQERLEPPESKALTPGLSIAGTLRYAAQQKLSRDSGQSDWRILEGDSSMIVTPQPVYITLSMTTELISNIPSEGVRWLYLRTETRSIADGRMDMQSTLLDESMNLVAMSTQVAQLFPADVKTRKQDTNSKPRKPTGKL